MLQRGLLDLPEISGFLELYVQSAAFHDAPSFFLHELEQYGGPLPPFSTVIFTLCEEFARGFADESRNPAQRSAYAGSRISPLLLRLYEQSSSKELSPIRHRCLDMWDLLMEHRVGDVWTLTRQLDTQ